MLRHASWLSVLPLLSLAAAAGSAGCKFDDSRLSAFTRCQTSTDCAAPLVCQSGLCVRDDRDASVDPPVTTDMPQDGSDLDAGGDPVTDPVVLDGDVPLTGACGGQTCVQGETCCDDVCVSIMTSAGNCGGCSHPCDAPGKCCGGQCTDIKSDEANCGDCDQPCQGAERCCQGSCTTDTTACQVACNPTCDGTEQCCEGTCYPQRDLSHCGDCDTACNPEELCCDTGCTPRSDQNCQSCGDSCQTGFSCCPVVGCKRFDDDPQNCGDCGVVCRADQKCCDGACRNIMNDPDYCGEDCVNCDLPLPVCRDGACTVN